MRATDEPCENIRVIDLVVDVDHGATRPEELREKPLIVAKFSIATILRRPYLLVAVAPTTAPLRGLRRGAAQRAQECNIRMLLREKGCFWILSKNI